MELTGFLRTLEIVRKQEDLFSGPHFSQAGHSMSVLSQNARPHTLGMWACCQDLGFSIIHLGKMSALGGHKGPEFPVCTLVTEGQSF